MTIAVDPVRTAAAAVLPPDHPPVATPRIGVLLSNLGTPDATDYWSMRRYLAEFLSDRRVIETPRALWWLILNGVILTIRPGRKGKDYETIWNRERDESPLKTITRGQAEKLATAIEAGAFGPENAGRIVVDWGMRYGNPSLRSALDRLKGQGCDRILLVPLYPQYAAATTATACDKTFEALMTMRWQPSLRVAPPYHDDPAYIAALARSLREGLARLDFEPEVILASFHGVPKEYLLKGDPVSLPVRQDGAAAARGYGHDARNVPPHLPVALRPRRMAAALHRRDHQGAGARRREAAGRDHAWVLGRLPGDHRGDRRRKCGIFSRRRRRASSRASRASTTRRMAWR